MPWHFLYFLPLPQGQGSLRPTLGSWRWTAPLTLGWDGDNERVVIEARELTDAVGVTNLRGVAVDEGVRHALVDGDLPGHGTECRVVGVGHVGEPLLAGEHGAEERIAKGEIEVVGDEHHGAGPEAPRAAVRFGRTLAGVRHILLTHLDFDHAGGLEDFPRARVHVMQAEMEAAIMEYLENHNADPKPFIWTKSAAEILEKVARAKQALESQH